MKLSYKSIIIFALISFESCSIGVTTINYTFKLLDFSDAQPLAGIEACTYRIDSSKVCNTSNSEGIIYIDFPADDLHYSYNHRNYVYFNSDKYYVGGVGLNVSEYDSTYLLDAYRKKFINLKVSNADHLKRYYLYAVHNDPNQSIKIFDSESFEPEPDVNALHEFIYYRKYPNYITKPWQSLDSVKVQINCWFDNNDNPVSKTITVSFAQKDTITIDFKL